MQLQFLWVGSEHFIYYKGTKNEMKKGESELIKFILIMIFCHLIGDYVLQNDFLAKFKGSNDFILLVHSALWSGTMCIGLSYLGQFNIYKLIFLVSGHFIIDRWKARKEDKTYALTRDLYIDQMLHMFQLIVVLLY